MLQNLHTHTVFSDGKNTPEEMVEKAISLGFDSIGFSTHAKTGDSFWWEVRDLEGYKKTLLDLKKKHEGVIDIFIGTELDYFSNGYMPTDDLDYKLASVHVAKVGDDFIQFDESYEHSKNAIEKHFGGDPMGFAKKYYEMLSELPQRLDFDFVGHFDLLTKFSENHPELIDTDSPEYRKTALEALHTLRKSVDFFELNTGAIGRGYRKTPYPAPFILREMKNLGCKIIITSDCHNKDFLDCYFKESKELLLSLGFKETYFLTRNGFVGELIK